MAILESIQIFYKDLRTYVCVFEPHHPPKGLIIFVHGLGEHIRRYDEQFLYFNSQGFAVISADLIGHGRSEGKRGVWSSLDTQYEVINGMIDLASKTFPDVPMLLYGHSMGGNLAAGYVCSHHVPFKGMILTGSAIITPKDMPKLILRLVQASPGWIKNIVIPNGLHLKSLCSDAEVVKKYKADPLVHDRISLGSGTSLLVNAHRIMEAKEMPSYPILLMHGGKDTITLPEGTIRLKQKWNHAELKIWPELLHEIHNEPNKKEIWDYTLTWMNKVLGEKNLL